jgi:hypothetical protein
LCSECIRGEKTVWKPSVPGPNSNRHFDFGRFSACRPNKSQALD